MRKTKNLKVTILATCLMASLFQYATAAQPCGNTDGVIVIEVATGNISSAVPNNFAFSSSYGIFFRYKNNSNSTQTHLMPISGDHDLDNPDGPSIYSLLKTALISGAKVKMWNSYSDCNSVDTIMVVNY